MPAFLAGCSVQDLFPGLTGLIPTEEELAAFNERVESLPSLQVRIVNNTDVLACVELDAGISGLTEELFGVVGGESVLNSVDQRNVLIAAGGTVTGSIKCGEVIGLSIHAPFNGPAFGTHGESFGLFLLPGNIEFAGAGFSDDTFSGDLVSTVRFLRPEADEIDCESDVLVVEIDTPATEEVVDQDTGEVIQPAVLGSAMLTLE